MQPLDTPKLIEFVIQLAGIVTGLLIIVVQVGRQHRSSLLLQKENLRDAQRIKLFDELSEKIGDAEAAVVQLGIQGLLLPSALKTYLFQAQIPAFTPVPIKYRSLDLQGQQEALDAALLGVISAIERREVIAPALVIFRYALSDQSERSRKAFQHFADTARPLLPVDPPEDLRAAGVQPRTLKPLEEEDIPPMEEAGGSLHAECSQLTNYLNDLSREIQNRLLGSLFDSQVHARKPLDPRFLVIGTSKESLQQAEDRLEIAKHLRADALPSRLLYPETRPAKIKAAIRRFLRL
jgi:hypothetical protein